MRQDLKALMEKRTVISFDIFDTLLVRNVLNPKDVWRVLGQKELADGFFAERDAADRATYAAATKRGGEHTLDEAYAVMGSRWAEFKRKGLESEDGALFANPEAIEIWNEAGRQLTIARNSTDVAHRRYAPIAMEPGPRVRTRLSFRGIPILTIRYSWNDGWNCRTLRLLDKIPLLRRKTRVYKLATIRKVGEYICV